MHASTIQGLVRFDVVGLASAFQVLSASAHIYELRLTCLVALGWQGACDLGY
ncbi:Uncharacterised protein [Corynebacterium renale]|uniref:Uncharacterized protein n=1 Tax=Corynebacterium renale TaxID=1724 RepID=A0A2A9DM84_9CORY|nr:hypothetical protein ATK06_0542 [Corynebacterium renale]SQI23278.1 Uncharacterised protein [Corynebacterium renale]